jgi:hypothetical protein
MSEKSGDGKEDGTSDVNYRAPVTYNALCLGHMNINVNEYSQYIEYVLGFM